MLTHGAWATTAYVSTYAELSAAISNASVDVIIVTANIDVPCGNSGNAGANDLTGASTAQLIINRSLTLQSQAGSKYVIRRTSASGSTSTTLKSIFAIRGNGQGTSGTANLTENTIQVTFTNIIIDGGAVWGSSTVCERRNGAANAYGNAGRSMIDVYLGGVLNLEDGVEIRNGFTTKSDNSLLNDASTSQCFGGAVRVDYHNATGGGTINIKAGATIHDCTARGGYGGALGAYNYARLNLYGGTIYNCSANHGGAIACTYRSASGYGDATAGTIRMYGGTISNCCAENGGALCTHGPVEDYVLGGTITSCSATYGGAIYQAFSTTVIHIVDHNSGKLTISNCTNTHETPTENTDGYHFVYLSSGSINVTPVYQVTFRDNNTDFAVLSVAQGTSLGEAFPAAPAKAGIRFLGWYNGNTQVTSSTVINDNITVTAKWEFYGNGTEGVPYQIPSADAWDFLAYNVNNGNTYSEKVFQMTNNISVTTMAGVGTTDGNYKSFNGTFDGNGHTLNVAFSGSGAWTAAFGALNGATIKNLHITGSISTSDYRPGSIAGFISGNSTITNCWSEVAISSSQVNNWVDAGAFVARINSGNTLTLNGCLFTGSITYTDENAYEGGGMVGWAQYNTTVKFYDCVFAPSAISITKYKDQYTFAATYDGYATKTIDNCYYNDLANATDMIKEGKLWHSITTGDNVTITNLGSSTATYDVSGITAYDHGIKYNDMYYAGASESVSLNLGHTSHSGYSLHGYSVTSGTLTGSSNPYTLTMADADATIYVRYSASISIAATTTDAKDGWYLIASPIGTVNPSNVTNMTNNEYDIFRFNQNPAQNGEGQYLEWENWKLSGSHYHFDLEPGRGYLYANSSNVTLTFIGTPYIGTGEFALEYSTSNPDTRMRGWNLVGNPFGTMRNIGTAFYRMNTDHNELIVASGDIAPMEGIFVYRDEDDGPESVTFSLSDSKGSESNANNIVINLSDNKGTIIDRAIVSFDNGRTLPKFQIKDNSTKLYIPQKGTDYAIAFSYRIGELPLNFKPQETGLYTLGFSGENMNGVSLVDVIDNAEIDLSVNDTYTFIGSPNDREDRFKLVFSSPNDSNLDIFAYQTGNDIVVSGEGELQVFDVMGRLVIQQRIDGVQTVAKPLQTGVYIFRLNEMVQKIVVR